MHTLAIGLAFLDDLGGNFHTGDTGLGAFLVGSKSIDHFLRNMDTGHVVIHELGHTGRLGDDNTQLHRLAELPDEREKEIIILRYGLSGGEPMTQRNVAQRLKISRSYVSRIEKKAIERLREGLSEDEDGDL